MKFYNRVLVRTDLGAIIGVRGRGYRGDCARMGSGKREDSQCLSGKEDQHWLETGDMSREDSIVFTRKNAVTGICGQRTISVLMDKVLPDRRTSLSFCHMGCCGWVAWITQLNCESNVVYLSQGLTTLYYSSCICRGLSGFL